MKETSPYLNSQPQFIKLRVEAAGQNCDLDDLRVAVQVTRTADVKLEIGAVGEMVTVSDEGAPVIQTDTPVQQLNVSETGQGVATARRCRERWTIATLVHLPR